MTIVKANEKERGPLISLEPVSETTFPSIWSASKSGLRGKIVDAPGFEDNRGEAQDIANTFYIKEIMRAAKSVKFVLNTDLNDIVSQNINNFTNFIDKMHRIFPETRVLHGGIALVFSKGSSVYSSSDICNFFKKNILNQNEMHVEKSLIQYFVEHEECIAFFEMPSSEGVIHKANIADNDIIDVIENKLKGIPGTALTDVQSGVSDKSKVFLLQSQAELCNQGQYFDLLQSVKDAFTRMTIEIYESESTERVKEIDKYLMSLYKFVYEMVLPAGGKLSLMDIVNKLSALCNKCGIQNLMDQSNIVIQVQFVEFLDEILRLNNSTIYIAKFQSTLETIKKDIYEARILAATKLKKITEEEAERQRRDVMEKHNVGMEQLLQVINTQTMANKKSVEDQLKSLGVLDMIVMTGKKILTKIFPGLKD